MSSLPPSYEEAMKEPLQPATRKSNRQMPSSMFSIIEQKETEVRQWRKRYLTLRKSINVRTKDALTDKMNAQERVKETKSAMKELQENTLRRMEDCVAKADLQIQAARLEAQQEVIQEKRKTEAILSEVNRQTKQKIQDLEKRFQDEKQTTVEKSIQKEREFEGTVLTLKAAVQVEQENVARWKMTAEEMMDVANEKEMQLKKVENRTKKIEVVQKRRRSLELKVQRREKNIVSLKAKLKSAEENIEKDREVNKVFYEGIINELKQQMKDKDHNEEVLKKQINQLMTLETKTKSGLYKTEIRMVYYHLLTLGVSANFIEPVIRTVLENLSPIDMKTTPLPKRSTAQRMKVEAGCLATVRGLVEWSRRQDKCVSGTKLTKVRSHSLSGCHTK
ncbi:inner centromere protein-like isoform X2 [Ptychodera flava]|uniref:inner centromere protein-like isoform X2 n=1 Tax=Ptychodera flava TaxID=63121 RepID=UPI00396A8D6E